MECCSNITSSVYFISPPIRILHNSDPIWTLELYSSLFVIFVSRSAVLELLLAVSIREISELHVLVEYHDGSVLVSKLTVPVLEHSHNRTSWCLVHSFQVRTLVMEPYFVVRIQWCHLEQFWLAFRLSDSLSSLFLLFHGR